MKGNVRQDRGRRAFRPSLSAPLEERRLPSGAGDVLTYHNDNARTGQALSETVLSPSTLSPGTFGKVFSQPVDGAVYAQPLYMSGVPIAGKGVHDVVFVATMHDSVYAFDADSNLGPNAAPLWHTSFINPAAGITPAGPDDGIGANLLPELGILSTPVIDPATGTLYVVATTREPTPNGPAALVQRLHALDVSSGAEKLGGPVVIGATAPGTGDGSRGGVLTFDPHQQLQRSGLLLSRGVVYIVWSSFGDRPPYHGWVIGYDARTLRQSVALNLTPDGGEGSIWMSGAAPAADAHGNIYLSTANGTFSADKGGLDYGDSVVRISIFPDGSFKVADYFAPWNQKQLESLDQDLGSGGVTLVPGPTPGSLAQAVTSGKEGAVYLLDTADLGGFHATFNDVAGESAPHAIGSRDANSGLWLGTFSTPAYFQNLIYYAGVNDALKAIPVAGGRMADAPVTQTANVFVYPGATPSISANGTSDAIVWAIENNGSAILHAYDAFNLSRELYNSSMAGPRDQLDRGAKFTVPTIAGGKVFVGTSGQLTVFGDLKTAYVDGERSLLLQGLGKRRALQLLRSSPDFVWHPGPGLARALDRKAQAGLVRRGPRVSARVRHETPGPRGHH